MSGRSKYLWRGMALLGFATGAAALAMQLAGTSGGADPQAARPAPPRAATAPALAGRTATLSRLLSERRAVARVQLAFGPNGTLDAACSAEAADGTQSPCFGTEKGTGSWAQNGARLCLAAAAVNLLAETCYEVSGEAPALTLSGPGFLAGSLQLR